MRPGWRRQVALGMGAVLLGGCTGPAPAGAPTTTPFAVDGGGPAGSASPVVSSSAPVPSAARVPVALAPPCAGDDLDLGPLWSRRECAESYPAAISEWTIEATLTVEPPTVAPGGEALLTLVLVNRGAAPITLSGPHGGAPAVEVRDAAGRRIAPPPEVTRPTPERDPICATVDCEFYYAHATIVPGGRGRLVARWQASRVVWPTLPPGVRADCCGWGDEVEPVPAGPLAPGRYQVVLGLPTVGHAARAAAAVTVAP